MTMKKPTILVAEDDLLLRHIFECSLSPSFDVVSCEDGQEALDVARTHQTDIALAVLDWDMPRLCGPDAGAILWSEHYIPFIIVSRGRTRDEIDYVFRKGAIDFFHKPVDDVHAMVDRLMGQPLMASITRERARRFPHLKEHPVDLLLVD